MKLAEQIAENERSGQIEKNEHLIKIMLKELVYDYTDSVVEVMRKTGVPVSAVLPDDVILTIVVRHLGKNKELREAISKMILEMDGHYNANGEEEANKGQGLAIVGGALSAVGSVLAGIGRGQFQNQTNQQWQQQQFIMQQQQMQQAQQRRRTMGLVIGISVVVIIAGILIVRAMMKGKQTPEVAAA